MREIKFRAWISDEKRMFFPSSISWGDGLMWCGDVRGGNKVEMSVEDSEVMQFTGSKDKNGKEIYEGDILDIEDFRGVYIQKQSSMDGAVRTRVTVEWLASDGKFILEKHHPFNERLKTKRGQEQYDRDLPYIWSLGNVQDPVIIGNIYENGELLK